MYIYGELAGTIGDGEAKKRGSRLPDVSPPCDSVSPAAGPEAKTLPVVTPVRAGA